MSWLKSSIAFSIPVVVAVGAVTLLKPSWYSALTAESEPMVEARPFHILDYPPTPPLRSLPRQWETASLVSGKGGTSESQQALARAQSQTIVKNEIVVEPEPVIEPEPQTIVEPTAEPMLPEWNLDDVDLSSLPPELALKVESALAQPNTQVDFSPEVEYLESSGTAWQGRLPALDFQTHMYASDERRRWVKINGQEYYQGDDVGGGVYLSEILPQAVIIEFAGKRIQVPALYEWQG